jgi:trypsin
MKTIIALSLLSLSTLLHANNRIVGGELVDPATTETRYIVSLGGSCAGSIISPSWILTAAHCSSIFKSVVITGGNVNLKAKNRVILKIKNSFIHPQNNPSKYSYDFALLQLQSPIDFEKTGLAPITMVDPDLVKTGAIDDGVVATVLGWGTMSEGAQSITNLMRKVEIPIVSNDKANAPTSYNGQVDSTMIAAGYDQGKKDSCQGDSGGPLTIDGSDGKSVLAGVVSWGKGCARANFYGIYSNVAVAYPWIMETMKANQ